MSFLSSFTDTLIKNENFNFQNVRVILPNKRAQQRLYAELASRLDTPFFVPTVQTIDEFIQSLSPVRCASKTELLIDLYEVSRAFSFVQDSDFQKFISWGSCFLHDINEIDLYNCNPDAVFSNLSDMKDLEFFAEPDLTPSQRKYLEFYAGLGKLYRQFREFILQQGKGYTGMIYKEVAQRLEEDPSQLENTKIYFAGLHALSPTERNIARLLSRNNDIHFIFDTDPFYTSSPNNRIGQFIGAIQSDLKIEKREGEHPYYATIPKEITITGTNKQISQVLLAIDQLNQMSEEERNNTAVVFADESLLMPFVHAYQPRDANITMGYPIRHTVAYQLLQDLLSAAQNLRRLHPGLSSPDELEKAGYYYRDVLAIVHNGIIRKSLFSNESHTAFIEGLTAKNRIFLRPAELESAEGATFPKLSREGSDFLQELADFFGRLCSSLPDENDKMVLESFVQAFGRIRQLTERLPKEALTLATLQYFIEEELSSLTFSFIGNPESGLQLMGLLETRALDFDNILMLSANEGILPTGKSENSLLLYAIKRAYGLPTYENSDAIYGYHFFRLFQRAKKAYIYYNMDSSNTVSEESRFIRILEYEVRNQGLQEQVRLTRKYHTTVPDTERPTAALSIRKSAEDLKKIQGHRFSASSLNTYINCPLQFYLEHIARIKPEMTINENVEMNVMGTVIHGFLEDMMNDLKKKMEFAEEIINLWDQKVDSEYLQECFWKQEELKGSDLSHGKLFLSSEVVKRYLHKYISALKEDFSNCTDHIDIVATEMEMTDELMVGGKSVKLHGFADLVVTINELPHIFDYKSGKVYDLSFPNMSDVFKDPKYKQVLQLLLYCYLYTRKTAAEEVGCAIISLQAAASGKNRRMTLHQKVPNKSGKSSSSVEVRITADLLNEFKEELVNLIAGILHPDEKFEAVCDPARCKYCDYGIICGMV